MFPESTLHIRLTREIPSPRTDVPSVNEFCGGPETLLGWMETQLGLACPGTHKSNRVTEYANALDAVSDALFSASMKTDRWATASELLSRHDELLLAGWDEADRDSLPQLVRDLSRATQGQSFLFPGEAGRLRRVLSALEQGQTLPAHRCILSDTPDVWPILWRAVLAKLTTAVAVKHRPRALEGTALHSAQTVVRGMASSNIVQDKTFRFVATRSETAACEFVAASLSAAVDKLADTVIYCEDDNVAIRLDACLQRVGLPTTGASTLSRAHPVLQVLPLSLSLCWSPVDAQTLLGFLTLPVKPLSHHVAARLASSLAQEPGLGSSKWDEAVNELCSKTNDPEGKIRERMETWLLCQRVARGSTIPSIMIGNRCRLVAQWAAGRALRLDDDPSSPAGLAHALRIAAGQASLLGKLVQSQGKEVSESQLARLLDEAMSIGIETTPCIEADGGPRRVRSLAEIVGPCKRLIWLGLGTTDTPSCRWTASQLSQLRAAGLDLDDGSRQLSALRSAEERGFSSVQEFFLAVLVPKDWEQRWHPLWLAIRTVLEGCDSPSALEDLIAANDGQALAPARFTLNEQSIQPPQKERLTWTVPPGHLCDRTTASATELQDRLACPLKWVLNYQAKLRPSPVADLPSTHQLKGTFCHSVLERVFGSGGPLPSAAAAVERVRQIFEERLPLDAAPLAQAGRLIERQKLRDELLNATRVLVEALSAGGYHIVGVEVEVSKDAFGKTLNGSIDCVAARDDGSEVIVDFKYAGRNKYREMIRDGKAVQLATYAYSRSSDAGVFPAVAYLVLADAQLLTPSGSPMIGASSSEIAAPSSRSVWEEFSKAIDSADGWLTSGDPIPVRPLQSSSQWPNGASIVLDTDLKNDESQTVCRYCDYSRLCGLQETL